MYIKITENNKWLVPLNTQLYGKDITRHVYFPSVITVEDTRGTNLKKDGWEDHEHAGRFFRIEDCPQIQSKLFKLFYN